LLLLNSDWPILGTDNFQGFCGNDGGRDRD
jgi:hypothetical protein